MSLAVTMHQCSYQKGDKTKKDRIKKGKTNKVINANRDSY